MFFDKPLLMRFVFICLPSKSEMGLLNRQFPDAIFGSCVFHISIQGPSELADCNKQLCKVPCSKQMYAISMEVLHLQWVIDPKMLTFLNCPEL